MTACAIFNPTDEATYPIALKATVAFYRDRKANAPATVNERGGREITNDSQSQFANKRRSGEYPSSLDGTKRVFPTGPLYDAQIAKAIRSYGPDGLPLRARSPSGQFQKGHRPAPRSAAQLEALRQGNALRISRARAREAGAIQHPVRRKEARRG